ncbi:MAG: DUF4838 domain-containing protein, partial [Clostridia bacterium]|nr:DUF4838 domain-containing protein [Clostridia bacterium]
KGNNREATETREVANTKLVHNFGEYKYNYDATCTQNGTETRKCKVCQETETREVANTKLEHNFGAYVFNNDATCSQNGTETRTCINCKTTETREKFASKKAHSYTGYVYNNDATCTKNGTETRKCKVCEYAQTREKSGTKLEHEFGEYVSNNDATCTQNGTATRTCKNCQKKETKIVLNSMIAHTYQNGKCIYCDKKQIDVSLVSNNKSDYKIVLCSNATEYEKASADIIKKFFSDAYKITLQTINETSNLYKIDSKYIFIGNGGFLNDAEISVPGDLGDSGYILKTKGSNVFIANPTGFGAGLKSGAYRLLEEVFNYKAYAVDEISYNNPENVELTELDIEVKPDISALNLTGNNDKADGATQRALAGITNYSDIFSYRSTPYHNSFSFVDPGKYSESHPLWYSSDKTQLCYTAHGNTDEYNALVNIVYTQLKDIYLSAKDSGKQTVIIPFTQQDNGTFCNCSTCQTYNNLNNYVVYHNASRCTNSIPIVRFMNSISDKFKSDGIKDDLYLVFFAYLQTEASPKKSYITMRENVVPMVAPIYSQYSREDDFGKSGVKDLIDRWLDISEAKTPKFMLWTYSANYQNYLSLMDNFSCLSKNGEIMADYTKNGNLLYWYDEGSGFGEVAGVDFTYFKYWLRGKQAIDSTVIDSDTKFNALVDEFFDAYYKQGADAMKEYFYSYLDVLRDLHGKSNNGSAFYGYTMDDYPNLYDNYTVSVANGTKNNSPWFTKTQLESWRSLLQKAKDATVDNEKVYKRVLLESVVVDFIYLKLYGIDLVSGTDLTVLNDAKDQLKNDANLAGLGLISESDGIENAFKPELASGRMYATISDIEVLVVEAQNFDDSTPLLVIDKLCEDFDRMFYNAIGYTGTNNYNRLSQTDKNRMINAKAKYETSISNVMYAKTNNLIDSLPSSTSSLKVTHGSSLKLIDSFINRMNESTQNKLKDDTVRYNKYTTLKAEYDKKWGVAYNELEPWLNDSTLGAKANVGCDSYRIESSSELVNDSTYGTVTKVNIISSSDSIYKDNPASYNFAALFLDYNAVKSVVKNDPSIQSVEFYIKVNASNVQISTGARSFTEFNTTSGSWSKITLSREQFINGEGAVRKAGLTNTALYITNFYFIKSK